MLGWARSVGRASFWRIWSTAVFGPAGCGRNGAVIGNGIPVGIVGVGLARGEDDEQSYDEITHVRHPTGYSPMAHQSVELLASKAPCVVVPQRLSCHRTPCEFLRRCATVCGSQIVADRRAYSRTIARHCCLGTLWPSRSAPRPTCCWLVRLSYRCWVAACRCWKVSACEVVHRHETAGCATFKHMGRCALGA